MASTWQKGQMKENKETRSVNTNTGTHDLGSSAVHQWMFARPWLARLGCLSLAAGLLWSQSAQAFSFLPLGEGTLPSGQIVSMIQVTFDPGESFPWHFHTGPLWGVIVSGTLTEDEGCATALNTYAAGSAFSEIPGRVHQVFNNGTVPVVINFTVIVPPCYGNYNNTILVEGPRCEGRSGRSHLEQIPPCP